MTLNSYHGKVLGFCSFKPRLFHRSWKGRKKGDLSHDVFEATASPEHDAELGFQQGYYPSRAMIFSSICPSSIGFEKEKKAPLHM